MTMRTTTTEDEFLSPSHQSNESTAAPSSVLATSSDTKMVVEDDENDSRVITVLNRSASFVMANEPNIHDRSAADTKKKETSYSTSLSDKEGDGLSCAKQSYQSEHLVEETIERPNSVNPIVEENVSRRPGAVAVHGPRIFSTEESYAHETDEEDPQTNNERQHSGQRTIGLPQTIITVVTATPVDETILVEAEPMQEKDPRTFVQKYRYLLIGSIVAIGIVVAAAIAVLVSRKQQNMVVDQRIKAITRILVNVSEVSTSEFSAAQRKAMDWIFSSNNKHLDPEDNWDRIVQRYALAVLYYSTDGEQWAEKGTFLSDGDECDWHPSLNCTTRRRVAYVMLGESLCFV